MMHYGRHDTREEAISALRSGEDVSLYEDEVPGLNGEPNRTVTVDVVTRTVGVGRRYVVEGITFESSDTALSVAEKILGLRAVLEETTIQNISLKLDIEGLEDEIEDLTLGVGP